MSDLLSADFVEKHVNSLPSHLIPESWGLEKHGVFYQLDLKMCQMKSLDFSFRWGDDSVPVPRLASIIDTPSKIARLDLSLNELTSIPHDGLLPFRNLRALDVSLNQLRNFQGVEVLNNLYSLNLSHNNLRRVDGLLNSQSLGELNLSNNEIHDISGLPSLVNLRVFNISNNKLKSLDGVSAFPKLEEVNVSGNELKELIPLTSCLRLRVILASNNHIASLDSILRLITRLKSLQVLNLSSNPVERDRSYQSDILRAGNLMTLDNVSVRPMPPEQEDRKRHAGNMYSLKDAAKQAFEERMRMAKDRMEENVNFLQRRIIAIQKEYRDYEQKLKSDLEACLRYLDSLSEAELSNVGHSNIGATLGAYGDSQMPDSHRHRGHEPKTDYSNVRQTDEVLRFAFKELVKEKDRSLNL